MVTDTIRAIVNGEEQSIPRGQTVAALIASLGLPAERVAVEFNREILKRDRWPGTSIDEGSRIELVQFVGGG